MAKIIKLATKRPISDMDDEPCTKCDPKKKEMCSAMIHSGKGRTCEKATIWWSNFVIALKGDKAWNKAIL